MWLQSSEWRHLEVIQGGAGARHLLKIFSYSKYGNPVGRFYIGSWPGQLCILKSHSGCSVNNLLKQDKNETRKAGRWHFLLVQWVRIHPSMQRTQVRPLVREDPRSLGAAEPLHHSY